MTRSGTTSPTALRRRPALLLTALVALLVAVLAPLAVAGGGSTGSSVFSSGPASVAVRVDQVGYASDGPKTAFVMGTTRSLKDARFAVLDARGRAVLRGRLGTATGRWNARYSEVRTVDLSALRRTGSYRLRVYASTQIVSPPFTVRPADVLSRGLTRHSVRFFQAQRDGRDVLPEVLGRRPSHLLDARATVYATPAYDDDGVLQGGRLRAVGGPVDVEGGWFDAGDFLKFTGTNAYAVTSMLVAARTDPDPQLASEAQFGLRWLDKMWDARTGTLYAQVGIGNGNDQVRTDHDVWRLPEDDDARRVRPGDPGWTISHRPVFRANPPGEPVPPSLAGRTAAAFALASQSTSGADAERWLDRAAQVLAAADTSPSSPDANATAVPAAFYPEDSWQDDLELGNAEAARAARLLGDDRAAVWQRAAAAWARRYIESDTRGTLEVADVSALAHAELVEAGDPTTPLLLADLRRQLDEGVDRARRDPFRSGTVITDFDSVPHALGLAATARTYERLSGDRRYRAFADQQISWVLGANPWGTTFVVGEGTVYPRCPEHQVDNLAGAGDAVGGVVNGPNRAALLDELNTFPTMKPCRSAPGRPYADFDGHGARYLDDVGAWQTVEPAIDFTANAVLAFSASA